MIFQTPIYIQFIMNHDRISHGVNVDGRPQPHGPLNTPKTFPSLLSAIRQNPSLLDWAHEKAHRFGR